MDFTYPGEHWDRDRIDMVRQGADFAADDGRDYDASALVFDAFTPAEQQALVTAAETISMMSTGALHSVLSLLEPVPASDLPLLFGAVVYLASISGGIGTEAAGHRSEVFEWAYRERPELLSETQRNAVAKALGFGASQFRQHRTATPEEIRAEILRHLGQTG